MAVTIKQKVKFDIRPTKLFKFYMDPKLHAELIGGKAVVSKEPGSRFSVWGKAITGKMLHVKNNKMIVQTWRGDDWEKTDVDSILILTFSESGEGTEMEMVHANVPEKSADEIKQGWKDYYWKPWKAYIKKLK